MEIKINFTEDEIKAGLRDKLHRNLCGNPDSFEPEDISFE